MGILINGLVNGLGRESDLFSCSHLLAKSRFAYIQTEVYWLEALVLSNSTDLHST